MYRSNEWDRLRAGNRITVYPEDVHGEVAEYVDYKGPAEDSYGYDGEGPVSLIFKVGSKHYKITGYQSSYGGVAWDGKVVEATKKVVEVWE